LLTDYTDFRDKKLIIKQGYEMKNEEVRLKKVRAKAVRLLPE